MEISYAFRFSDYEALTIAMRSAGKRKLALALFWFALLANAAIAVLIARTGDFAGASVSALLALFMLLAFFLLIPMIRRWNFRRLNLAGKTVRIILGEAGLRTEQQGIEGMFAWSAFTRFSKLKTHAFLWVNKVQALVIPFDAFPNEAEHDNFLDFISTKISPEA